MWQLNNNSVLEAIQMNQKLPPHQIYKEATPLQLTILTLLNSAFLYSLKYGLWKLAIKIDQLTAYLIDLWRL